MPWERRRYRKNKVWIHVDSQRTPVLDGRGLASLRYKVDDERTYTVRPDELGRLATPEDLVDAPDPEPREPATAGGSRGERRPRSSRPVAGPGGRGAPGGPRQRGSGAPGGTKGEVRIYTDGSAIGNPGPGGLGVVMRWGEHLREFGRHLGETTNNVAELTAVLEALQAVKRPELPVRIHTDSEYVIGVLTREWKVKANHALVRRIRKEMSRFPDLEFIKVPAHAGVPDNERADQLAQEAARSGP